MSLRKRIRLRINFLLSSSLFTEREFDVDSFAVIELLSWKDGFVFSRVNKLVNCFDFKPRGISGIK